MYNHGFRHSGDFPLVLKTPESGQKSPQWSHQLWGGSEMGPATGVLDNGCRQWLFHSFQQRKVHGDRSGNAIPRHLCITKSKFPAKACREPSAQPRLCPVSDVPQPLRVTWLGTSATAADTDSFHLPPALVLLGRRFFFVV